MKKALYLFFLIPILGSAVVGCKKDEAQAPVPVDGLKAFPGLNRAMVEFDVPAEAKSGKVFYGNGNFKVFDVEDANAIQQIIMEDFSEEEHTFRVITLNSAGISSDPRAVKVKVFGENYLNGLKARKWADQVNLSPTSIQLVFEGALAGEEGVRVVYTTTSGTKDSVVMSKSQNSVQVNNIDLEKPNYYYSFYKPTTDAIDEFNSAPVDLKEALRFVFKKENWSIAGVSGAATGKAPELLIDNNINTSWQASTDAGFPQWVAVDMGGPKVIDGFYFVNHQGKARSAKTVRFEVSDDNVTWTLALETQVRDVYTRQRFPLSQTITKRYIRVTLLDAWNTTATSTQFAEIDVYNTQNSSADNGQDNYSNTTAIPLVNAVPPFQGDGTDLFAAVGAGRMQKMLGWTHNPSAHVSFDNNDKSFSLFTAAVWGLGQVTNGKIYQSVNLQPGKYQFSINVGAADGPVDMVAVVSENSELPNVNAVSSSASVITYLDLIPNQSRTVQLMFTVTEAGPVRLGFVYNTRDQYSTIGRPWTSFKFAGFALAKLP